MPAYSDTCIHDMLFCRLRFWELNFPYPIWNGSSTLGFYNPPVTRKLMFRRAFVSSAACAPLYTSTKLNNTDKVVFSNLRNTNVNLRFRNSLNFYDSSVGSLYVFCNAGYANDEPSMIALKYFVIYEYMCIECLMCCVAVFYVTHVHDTRELLL